jgi:hypothetical protein
MISVWVVSIPWISISPDIIKVKVKGQVNGQVKGQVNGQVKVKVKVKVNPVKQNHNKKQYIV